MAFFHHFPYASFCQSFLFSVPAEWFFQHLGAKQCWKPRFCRSFLSQIESTSTRRKVLKTNKASSEASINSMRMKKNMISFCMYIYIYGTFHADFFFVINFFSVSGGLFCPPFWWFSMSFLKVELKTLHGGIISLELRRQTTLGELKAMLLEKHPSPDLPDLERQILTVELLLGASIVEGGEETGIAAAGLVEAEDITVIYKRNEVEAATQEDMKVHDMRDAFFHLKIPKNCTEILIHAFQYCSNLVSVSISESVTHIGVAAFGYCRSLVSITLGGSVTHIGQSAFHGCNSLANITLVESVTHIGHGAFFECASLASITLGESVTHIRGSTFRGCSSLASITLGESVTHIEDSAFACCRSLASITLGESVTDIGKGAFDACTSLASITLSKSVTHIRGGTFCGCSSLVSVSLGESVTRIGENAFRSCTSLASITLGESVTHIGDGAFERCRSLASITLGKSVTHIGKGAFDACTSLASITLSESVTHIGGRAFYGCTSLASITLGESVTHIGDAAFYGCTSLASITLGESVTHIGDCAFYGCTSLASIIGGESLTYVGMGAFDGCTSLHEDEWALSRALLLCSPIAPPNKNWRGVSYVQRMFRFPFAAQADFSKILCSKEFHSEECRFEGWLGISDWGCQSRSKDSWNLGLTRG